MNIGIKYERGFIKPDKNSLILLGIILVSAILVGIGLFYYFKKGPEIIIQGPPEDPMKAVIRSLTAPDEGESTPISEEAQESLSSRSNTSAPSNEEEENILKNLTAPE